MLNNNQYGYAVMNKELDAYSFEDHNLENCKRYCRNGDVIVERIPYVSGFSIKLMWYKSDIIFSFKKRYGYMDIWRLHIYWNSEHLHRTGKIMYKS